MNNCPFCSNDSLVVMDDANQDFFVGVSYYVFCRKCQASGPTKYSRNDAIDAWNKAKSDFAIDNTKT